MKILLDESVPRQIRPALTGHDVETVRQRGWTSVTNGELLRLAEGEFEVFVTADKNLKYQQNLTGRTLAILELSTNKRRVVEANLDLIRSTVANMTPGTFTSLTLLNL